MKILKYEKIFQKGKIGGLTLKNRIVMSPMHDGLGRTGGDVSERAIEYYAARAKGGVGLIINGFTVVCPDELSGTACAGQSALLTLDNRNSFQYLAERVHEYDTKLFVQLHHPGRSVYAPEKLNGGRQPVSCTAMPASMKNDPTAKPARELTVNEIKKVEQCFADAAVAAFSAGCDGVEVHCAHGYLFSQFITPSKNDRTDEYGGSLENNCRIVTETLDMIRQRVPKSFPVSCRINGIEADFRPNGIEFDMEYMRGVAKLLEAHGADVINVSMGGLDCITSAEVKAGSRDAIIKNIKEAITIPVIAVNVIKTPEEAEKMMEDEISDFVSLGRQLVADPDWVVKAKEDRADDILPCISCNNCINQSGMQAPIRCSVNPLAGREIDDNTLTNGSGKVIVIGAGPAGVEAALTCAKKGYEVLLLEKSNEIGGSLQLANKAPGKFRMDNLINYYNHQIEKNERITLNLNCELTADKITEYKQMNPKAVILATGGNPIIPAFPGAEKAVTANDVLSGKINIEGKQVVVIGGGMTGIETAELLATKNNQIVICEMLPMFGMGTFMYSTVKAQLGLAKSGVAMKKSTLVTGIEGKKVSFKDIRTDLTGSLLADEVVLALGVSSDISLLDELKKEFATVINIGDSSKPGKIYGAVSDGYHKLKKL